MKLSKEHLYEAFRDYGEDHITSVYLTESVFDDIISEGIYAMDEAPLASRIGRAFAKHGSKLGGAVDKVRNSKIGKMAIDKAKNTKFGKQFARGAGSAAKRDSGFKNAFKGSRSQGFGKSVGKAIKGAKDKFSSAKSSTKTGTSNFGNKVKKFGKSVKSAPSDFFGSVKSNM
jgi:hypothetical protein